MEWYAQLEVFAFYTSAFKFYLSQQDICQIGNVVLVIDDIEGIRIDSDEKKLFRENFFQ